MNEDTTPPRHVQENRRYWDATAVSWVAAGERAWASTEPYWGVFGIPEAELGMLPQDMTGMRCIELGCGTGYVSAWMARRGAEVVGIDNSKEQLDTARRLSSEHGVDLTLIHGDAERVPRPDGSFDFAISEYGAAIWCDPYVWIPEAHRLLTPGGRLVFLGNTPWLLACMPLDGSPAEPALHRTYFDSHRFDWTEVEVEPGGIEFNLTVSDWMRLFREVGFHVHDYRELQAPADAETRHGVPAEWARRWPAEHVWVLDKAR